MNVRDIISIITALSLLSFGMMERWEKIEVARVMATACAATVEGLMR